MITTAGPAAAIRKYIDDEGSVEVPFHHLLTSWGVEEPTSLDRQEMVAELSAAGVRASQPLGELAPDDVVIFSLSASSSAAPPPVWFNGPSAGAAMPAAGNTLTYPPVPPVPSPPKAVDRRRWLKIALVTVGVLLLAVAAGVGGAFYGQSTRLSDSEVGAKLDRQAAHAKRVFTQRSDRALTLQKRKLTRQRKAAVAAAQKRGQQTGYTSGQDAGYSSGNAAGYSAGHSTGKEEGKEAGVEEGMNKASDELSCSDDTDVPLPACNF